MLMNLRNALMAGKRLPYDAEVEYLESTGTQWIDTGVNAKQSLKIRAVFETNSSTSYFAYGVRAGNSTISCASGTITTGNLGFARWGTSAHASAAPSGLVDITQDSSGVIVNGTSYSYNATQTVVEQSGYTMVVFAGRNSTTTVTANIVGKFYSFKIWDNGVLVRDYIPVRKGTVGYLYDRVSGKLFGNAGTGDFVVGPDVVPVEYIESHGTEWIDTGIDALSTTDFDFEITARFPSVPSAGYFGSGYTSSSGVQMFYAINAIATTGLYMACNSTTTIASNLSADKTSWHSARAISTDGIVRYYFDGVQVSSFESSAFTLPRLYLFAFSDTGGNAIGLGPNQISSFRFSANNIPRCSFLPVRVGTEGAMMDVLTRRIYRNAGAGAFGYGNDLKYPIPAS